MADINQIITQGIGTPAGITEFLTVGLQVGDAVVSTASDILFVNETLAGGGLASEVIEVGMVASETLKTAVFATEALNQ